MHKRLSCPGNLGEVCHVAANTREPRGRKKAINSDSLESTVRLGIEQYGRRNMVEG